MNTSLSRKIMRRTYYAFAIHMLTRPLVRFSVPFVIALFIFAKLVFVAAVFANAQTVGLAQLPWFAITSVINADTLTLASILVLGFVVIGLLHDLALALVPTHQRRIA